MSPTMKAAPDSVPENFLAHKLKMKRKHSMEEATKPSLATPMTTPRIRVTKSVTFDPTVDDRPMKRSRNKYATRITNIPTKHHHESRQPTHTSDGERETNSTSPSPFRIKPSYSTDARTRTASFDRAELASAMALASLSKDRSISGSFGSGSFGSGSFGSSSFSGSFGAESSPPRKAKPTYPSGDIIDLVNESPKSSPGDVTMYMDQCYSPDQKRNFVTPESATRTLRTTASSDAMRMSMPSLQTSPSTDSLRMKRLQASASTDSMPMSMPSLQASASTDSMRMQRLQTSASMDSMRKKHRYTKQEQHMHLSRMAKEIGSSRSHNQYYVRTNSFPAGYSPPHPSSNRPMPALPPAPSPAPAAGRASLRRWACDFCHDSFFLTYEEACAHEAHCSHKPSRTLAFAPSAMPRPHPMAIAARQVSEEYPRGSAMGARMPSEDIRDNGYVVPMDLHEFEAPAVPKEQSNAIPISPIPLCVPTTDGTWLSDLNVYIRRNCIEVFTASEVDVTRTSKRGRILLNQCGIRCRFCITSAKSSLEDNSTPYANRNASAAASVSFPVSISGIYESVKRWHRVHTEVCTGIPKKTKAILKELAESSEYVPTSRQYWSESAKALGMVDSPNGGIFFAKPPAIALQEYNASRKAKDVKKTVETDNEKDAVEVPVAPTVDIKNKPLIICTDEKDVSPYVFFLMSQVQATTFTEADRFVARSKGPIGFAGFECKYCSGHAGLGKYFPSSIKSMSTNSMSQNIHSHMLKCRRVPEDIKGELEELKKVGRSTDTALLNGWRRRFFDKVWHRLHGDGNAKEGKASSSRPQPMRPPKDISPQSKHPKGHIPQSELPTPKILPQSMPPMAAPEPTDSIAAPESEAIKVVAI